MDKNGFEKVWLRIETDTKRAGDGRDTCRVNKRDEQRQTEEVRGGKERARCVISIYMPVIETRRWKTLGQVIPTEMTSSWAVKMHFPTPLPFSLSSSLSFPPSLCHGKQATQFNVTTHSPLSTADFKE